MQTSYDLELAPGFNGMKADSGYDDVKSMIALEPIPFGAAVVKGIGKDKSCRLPMYNGAVITDDAGTFTGGSISCTVNGTTYSQTWGTDKATTLTALAAKIAADPAVDTCVYSDGGHTITLVANNNYDLENVTVDVSGVTGNMTISSIVHSCSDVIMGIAVATHKEMESDQTALYNTGEAVNVMSKGRVFSYVEEALGSDDTPYLRVHDDGATKQRGQLLKTSTTDGSGKFPKRAIAAGVKFLKTITGAGLTIVEVNFPQ